MKTLFSFSLQNVLRSLPLLLLAGLLASCNQDDDTNLNSDPITSEEAVAIVEGALTSGSEGVAQEATDAARTAEQYQEKGPDDFCGLTGDSTVTRNVDNAFITANYTTSWLWTVNCNENDIPVSLDFSRTAQGNYETQRMISDDNASSDWFVDNLLFGTYYELNGSYTRSGSQISKVRNQNALTTQLDIAVQELRVNKGNYRIDSGTATFTLTGAGTGGTNFEIVGEIEFLGDGQALVTINGETFEIDL